MEKSHRWQTWLESLRTELARLPALAEAEASAAPRKPRLVACG
jgi:hypothetical protein